MSWYVLYTKPKWEKKVAENLNNIGIECYCPIVTKIQQWSDRKKKVQLPLFNSYVFVQLLDAERERVFQVAGALRYLFWLGKPAVVRDAEIQTIRESILDDDESEILVEPFKKGDRIKLDKGAFSNQDVIVQEVSKTYCIVVLESMGCVLKIKQKKRNM